MNCYIVIYNLQTPDVHKSISQLHNALRSFERWGRLTEYSWAIVSNKSAKQIRDCLVDYLGPNDQIIVIRSGREAAWHNLLASNDWLKTNLPLG